MASEVRGRLNLTPDEWARVQAIFEAALDSSPGQRAESVRAMCDGDERLRASVEQLLAGHESPGGVLAMAATGGGAVEGILALPCVVGAYRLLERIGSGGMGTVYRAERADGQFEKQVAIKLIGGSSNAARAEERFRTERQILARLEHPYVARLMDGGVTDDGRQYIVMEYVEGVQIDRYVREKQLGVQETVRLFQKSCAAVAYAHENSVVHRDLKPGNLLVTADGTPKLLDFGISKLWEEEPIDGSVATLTEERSRALTPDYASPEQLVGGKATPTSDVYSLGVLLYELLTGRRPYDMASARNGGLEQLLERGPTAPSGVSKREKGAERVSRDLDAIVLKALSRNAAARYESAKELREDLDRYLAQRPVAARPRAVLPRVGKFVVRRRWQCVAAVVVAISAAGFVVLQRYQVRRTSQRNLETVKSVRALFTSFNDRVAQLPESTETRRAIIMELVSRLEGLDELAGSDPDLLYEVALCYYDVGRVWSSAAVETLFDTSRAYDSFERARLFAQRAAQISGKERDRLLIAKVLIGRTLAALTDYNFEDVIRFSQEAESFIRLNQQSLLRIEKREITDGRLSQLMVYRSMALVAQDRPNEALEARDGANRLLGGEWRLSVADRYTAVLLNGTAASHLCYSGMTVDGMEQARRAASISAEFMRSQKRASIEDASDWTSIVMVQCEIQSNRGREALALLRPLIEVALRAHQRDPGQKHALLALVDRYELAGEAFLVLGQASRAEDIERKGMSLLLSLDESVRDSRAELMRAQVEFGLGRATRVQATESNMQGAAARALLKSSCEHYARAERQFTGFLNQHGGIPIASRRMMERTAEELRTFCSIAN